MKRKTLLIAMSLLAAVLGMGLSAQAADLSADDLYAKMMEASAGVDSASAVMRMNVDLAMTTETQDAPAQSLNVKCTGNFDLKSKMDPITVSMIGSYDMDVAGMPMSMDLETYVAQTDDGKALNTYTKSSIGGEESDWVYEQADLEQILAQFGAESIQDLTSIDVNEMFGGIMEWNVSESEEGYEMTTVIEFSDLLPMIKASAAAQMEGDDESSEFIWMIAESILGEFHMNLSYTLDKETYLTKKCHLDMNDLNKDGINGVISTVVSLMGMTGEDTGISNFTLDELNDISYDIEFVYDGTGDILIPAGALAKGM